MVDFRTAKMLGYRRNIERYCRLLTTELTDLERQYLHKRIAEEYAQLELLEKSQAEQQADVVMAAEAPGKRTGGAIHAERAIRLV
jgi:bacterioferritin (cytochrome b1)